MSVEAQLTDAVGEIVESILPGDRRARRDIECAALVAMAAGASMAEACEEARRLAASRARHPSREPLVTAVPTDPAA